MTKSLSKTPAPPKDRIYGSKVNPKGSASSEKSAKSIKFDAKTIASLTTKLKEFKETHNTKKVSLSDLKAVYRRGLGAYSSSHRPTISGGKPNSRNAWAMARVNAFLRKAGGGESKKAYVQDDDLLKMHLGGDMSKHLAPNGKPSNLTHEQWHLVRTPEFKAWFGDWEKNPKDASKVVDENGEPLVIYHGTDRKFTIFNKRLIGSASGEENKRNGFYFTSDYDTAKFYANLYDEERNYVVTCFLNLRNPIIIPTSTPSNIFKIIETAFDKGNDGVFIKSVGDSGRISDQIIAFEPNQIKLADGTNTTFDGSNADIRYAKGGKLDVMKEEKRLGVLSINETHNYLKNKYKSYKKKNAEFDDLPNIFIRAGLPKIKKDGTFDVSMNFYLGKKEKGVSVFDAKYSPNSDFVFIDFSRGASGSDTSIYMTYSNSQFDLEDDGDYDSYLGKMYLLEGDFIGYGGDGEYLLNPKTLKVIGLLNPNKVVPPKSFLKEYLGGMNIYFGGERFEKYPRYADGGDVGQEIKCRNCGWNWNTKDSEEFDKYVCHNCGFDNRTYYDKDVLAYNGGGVVKSFYEWYVDWYKGIKNEITILISLPNELQPFKENNVVIINKFKKERDDIKAYNYLQQMLNKADEFGITIYLEPTPIGNVKTKSELIDYYKKFGFQLTPNKEFMQRLPRYKDGGEIGYVGNEYLEEKYGHLKKKNAKFEDLPEIYIRIGLPKKVKNKYLPSRNHLLGILEDGVSVFTARYSPNSKFVFVDLYSESERSFLSTTYGSYKEDMEFYGSKIKMYLLEGNPLGDGEGRYQVGADYERLLDTNELKVIGELNPKKIIEYSKGTPSRKNKSIIYYNTETFSGEDLKKYPKYKDGGEVKRENVKNIKDAIRYIENSPKARMEIDFEDEEGVKQAINEGKDYVRIFPLKSKPNSFIVKRVREGVQEKYYSIGTWNEKKKSFDYKYFKNEKFGDKSKEYDTLQIATYDEKGKIVGVIRIATSENKKEDVKKGAFKISVREDYQNKGIASKLIEKVESEGIDFVEALKNNNFTSKGRWYFISWLNKKLKNKVKYKDGGEVDEHKETYKKWRSLVNMSKGELERFYNSEDGKKAGLSSSEAKSQGISSGRESARWIMKMKDTRVADWTPQMWKWANKQISFISRMSGNKGGLYDDKGNKTRKHTSLLIWGHNPEKKSSMQYEDGGHTDKYEISDYWETESFGSGGEVKTKSIITDKIGWNEEVADYFISQDPKLAIWLADGFMKVNLEKNWLPEDSSQRAKELYGIDISDDPDIEEFLKIPIPIRKKIINDGLPTATDFQYDGGYKLGSAFRQIREILDWLKHPLTQKQDLKNLSIPEALDKAKEWHKELKSIGGNIDFVEPEENEILITYPKNEDGVEFYWVKIPYNFCSLESSRMGHCGRTGSGNTLISLRSIRPYGKGHTINDSHVTIAYNEKDGIFYQTKGKKNQKPAEKYYPYIFDLIKTLAQEDKETRIDEYDNQIEVIFKERQKTEALLDEMSEQIGELRRKIAKYETLSYNVKNNRDYNEVNKIIDEEQSEIKKINLETNKLLERKSDFDLGIKLLEYKKEELQKMYRYGFGGFGAEYGSEEDYGFGEMTDEQVKELYEINPSLFSKLGGRLTLYNRGVIEEKPDLTFILDKDAEYISEFFKYDGRAEFLYNVISGNLLEDFEYSVDRNEVVKYYLDDLNEKNKSYIIAEISNITNIPIEEVVENGIEYYLGGDYLDDSDEAYDFDSIIDAIRRAVTYAMESDANKYYYGEIKSALSELGEVLQLDDDKVKVKIDLSKFLTMNQIESYSQELGDSIDSIFFEAEYRNDIKFPRLIFDDRFTPNADSKLINEYFEPEFYADGGTLPDIRMEDTIARIDDPRLADISYYKKGGTLELNEPILYHEVQGNFFIGKNTIYMWLYDDPNATSKLQSGEYDWVFFQPTSIYQASEKGFVPPLLRQWHKKYQKNMKGSEHLMAILKAWYDEKEKKMYILMMTTHPKFRKKGIMAKMIKDLREEFNLSQDDIIFDKPTDMGKAFMEAKKFDEGGTINKQINSNIMDEIKFNQLPHIDTIIKGDKVIIKESVFTGNIDNPKHMGERYIHCEILGDGGMLNSLNLKVINSVGVNAMLKGQKITRPINNLLTKGRKVLSNATTSFKDGGLNPDNKNVKEYFAHDMGNAGGVLVGKRHSEGGIKAINKGTGQPLEMEGGEVVITRGAVSNPKKYKFNGNEMTTREILSKLNVDGGGVSFAEGGDVPDKMTCGCDKMDFGGTTMSVQDFVQRSDSEYQEERLRMGIEKERKDHYDTLSKLNAGTITIQQALNEIAKKEMKLDTNYPFGE